jgi:uncharacterized repeat protein (TIGR03837 family)
MTPPSPPLAWDIFCNVIDNYGDIGVAWRLAQQLRQDHGQEVRLWVDDLDSFARLCPELNPDAERQRLQGVDVRLWRSDFPCEVAPGDVVLDAFGCTLPECFLESMAARMPPPLWINLEYLSAETWVDSCHGMVSPHARLPLKRYFFFPGFSAESGGVLAEHGLSERVRAWQNQPALQQAYRARLGLPPRQADEYCISLFAYENPAVGPLLRLWANSPYPVRCLVPEGRILTDIVSGFSRTRLEAGDRLQLGALSLHVLPFSDQADYDRLLWSCDLNFVRGEDSFMRAQWAARPLVWHIYPQQESAHWLKLDAFWQRYGADLDPGPRQALLALNHAWNHGRDIADAWRQFDAARCALERHAARWPQVLLRDGDLLTRLLRFVAQQRAADSLAAGCFRKPTF